jgi:hypothetical protein
VELGPGDSLGTGLAALLCGAEKYIGLDAFSYGDAAVNVKIFDELVILFRNRTALPAETEYPNLIPGLDNYDFPHHILTDEILSRSMATERLAAIRKELASPSPSNVFVKHIVPWKQADIKNESVDFIFSQSVLQFTKLEDLYPAMHAWLKPGGLMAHVIDFSSLGISKLWNGHWAYSALEWKLFSFGKKMLLNRSWIGLHKAWLEKNNFNLLNIITYKKQDGLRQDQLAKEFKHLSNEDVETNAAYMLAVKVN